MTSDGEERGHVVLFSTGISSAIAAERVLLRRKATLLFTDTQFEDQDNYRFLSDVLKMFTQRGFDFEFVRLEQGNTPLGIFDEQGILGSDRVPVCSRILKSEQTERWIKQQEDSITLYFGFDYSELHRAERVTARYEKLGVNCQFPLTEPPYMPPDKLAYVRYEWEIEPPRMYELGFVHANCGGRCVRGKKAHWRHLLRIWPERFKQMEEFEAKFKGGKYSFMHGYSLRQLREDYQSQLQLFEVEDSKEQAPCLSCF